MIESPRELKLELRSGLVRGWRFGPDDGDLVVCVHGLSANARSFDLIAGALGAAGHAVVAIDLRGRGWSSITGLGSYGWGNHARDVQEVATQLGRQQFGYIGHSMGAFIGMELARQAGGRLSRVGLIDALGVPEPASLVPIMAAVQRLGNSHPSADAYVARVKSLGTITPWSPVWETHYRYDLIEVDGGVRPRTDRGAVLEDMTYGSTQFPRLLWPAMKMPTLVVRAAVPLGAGFIISPSDYNDFLATTPSARGVNVNANHYGIMTSPEAVDALTGFFR
ncbi:MAG: alpha/beta hydrolase [Myxococcales bacterium]|nr:alpha/beta hydrolase [Myxococcales bacterium]